MLLQLQNLSYKSFNNYSTEANFFKQKNIIFGYNGRGKSSLAHGIVQQFLNGKKSESSIRFFNNEYVQKNLLLNDMSDGIKGVKISFSEHDANIAQEIALKNSQVQDVSDMQKTIADSRKNLREKIDIIHQEKKGKAQINKKKKDMPVESVLALYKKDLDEAKKIADSEEALRNFSADSKKYEEEKELIEEVKLPNLTIQTVNEDQQLQLMKILEKKYTSNEEIPSSEVIYWLEKGISLHDASDEICKFCNNKLNLDDIEQRIRQFQENSKQKDIQFLEKIKKIMEQNVSIINKENEFSSNLIRFDLTLEQSKNVLDMETLRHYESLSTKIAKKIANMENVILAKNPFPAFENEIEQINQYIKDSKKKKKEKLDATIYNLEKLAKGAIALAIKEANFSEEIAKIKENEAEMKSTDEKNQRLLKEIQKLKEDQSDYIDFMEYLNMVLKNLGLHIELILENENYYLKHSINGVDLSMDKISEGEKNLMSLLYFYFELYNDNKQNKLKDNIELIIIDDPISSLDDSNKFYVLEIIKSILSLKKVQIFILTHSWDDFCQITYGKNPDNTHGLFEIYKDPSLKYSSQIRECKNSISPYKKLFEEIFILSKKTADTISEAESYHAANSMRRVFEEFLNFKKPNLLPQYKNRGQIKDIYDKSTNKVMEKSLQTKMHSLLTFINVLSHRPVKSEEIIINSKTLMALIEDIDKVHFQEMIPKM